MRDHLIVPAIPPISATGKSNGVAHADADLMEMNAKYAVVKIGGKTRVVSMEQSLAYPGCTVPIYSSIHDFKAFHDKRRKKVVVGKDKDHKDVEKLIGIGTWWINHEERRQYDGIVYAPGADVAGKLNLWTGFGCKPVEGKFPRYLTHLHENVCSGIKEHTRYLLNWMADAVQHPDRPAGVAPVFRGKEGVGKGMAVKPFGRLFGSHFRHLSQGGHLTGHFNAHLQHCSVLYADEAFFAADRSHEGVIKALITEETLQIEPKGVDVFDVRNCLHILMSSNNDWVVPAGPDARRYFVIDVADTHREDHPYFAAIAKEMDTGGREALLWFLLNRDLKGFNIRDVPQTNALADQKAYSRRGVDRVVESMAHDGMLLAPFAPQFPNMAVTSGEPKGEGFYPAARVLAPDLKHVGSIIISRTLTEEWKCETWHRGNVRGIKFPPLKDLRAAFEQRHGPQKWQTNVDDWKA